MIDSKPAESGNAFVRECARVYACSMVCVGGYKMCVCVCVCVCVGACKCVCHNGAMVVSAKKTTCNRYDRSDDSRTRDTTSVRNVGQERHAMTSWMSKFGSFAAEL